MICECAKCAVCICKCEIDYYSNTMIMVFGQWHFYDFCVPFIVASFIRSFVLSFEKWEWIDSIWYSVSAVGSLSTPFKYGNASAWKFRSSFWEIQWSGEQHPIVSLRWPDAHVVFYSTPLCNCKTGISSFCHSTKWLMEMCVLACVLQNRWICCACNYLLVCFWCCMQFVSKTMHIYRIDRCERVSMKMLLLFVFSAHSICVAERALAHFDESC